MQLNKKEQAEADEAIALGQSMLQMYMAGYLDGYVEAHHAKKGAFMNKEKLMKDKKFRILIKSAFEYRFHGRKRRYKD